jgi:hypothetical protein
MKIVFSRRGRAVKLSVALAVAVAAAIGWSSPGKGPVVEVVYSGNRLGELMPCGCQSEMEGGVDREATLIASLRDGPTPVLLLDAGGFAHSSVTPSQHLRTRYLRKMMAHMGYEILNVGRADLAYGVDFLRESAAEDGFEFVSAVVLDPETLRPLFSPFVVKEFPGPGGEGTFRVAVTGFAAPDPSPPKIPAGAFDAVPQPAATPATTPPATSAATTPSKPSAPKAPTVVPEPPTPTPRVPPEATFRNQAIWRPLPSYLLDNARAPAVPLSRPSRKEAEDLEEQREKEEEARVMTPQSAVEKRMAELRERLAKPETVLNPPAAQPLGGMMGPPAPEPETTTAPPGPSEGAEEEADRSSLFKVPRPKGKEFVAADPVEALSRLVPRMRRQADLIVVLGHYPPNSVGALIEKVPGIDLLICGYGRSAPGKPKRQGTTWILPTGYCGRSLGRVAISSEAGGKGWQALPRTTAINRSFASDPVVAQMLADYKSDTKHLAVPRAKIEAFTLGGVEACRKCHEEPHDRWKGTGHARAMQALENNDQQYDPECLPCHTTYYLQDNGFRDVRTTPQFANVQCEVCHGPALEHSRLMRELEYNKGLDEQQRQLLEGKSEKVKPRGEPRKETCVRCHRGDHDPDFDFEVSREKIKH